MFRLVDHRPIYSEIHIPNFTNNGLFYYSYVLHGFILRKNIYTTRPKVDWYIFLQNVNECNK